MALIAASRFAGSALKVILRRASPFVVAGGASGSKPDLQAARNVLEGKGLLTPSEFLGALLLIVAERCARGAAFALAGAAAFWQADPYGRCAPRRRRRCAASARRRHPPYASTPALLLRMLCKHHVAELATYARAPLPWLNTRASDPELLLQVSLQRPSAPSMLRVPQASCGPVCARALRARREAGAWRGHSTRLSHADGACRWTAARRARCCTSATST